MTISFKQRAEAFSQTELNQTLKGIGRGIERETLRVLAEGKLAYTPHRKALGSALTHPQITTDYAENLLEFITPVSFDVKTALAQLNDTQKFTLENIDGELLWPYSMPCYVEDENSIELAQYGHSHIGKMKTVYRQGLKNRYGSLMQVIAGIHFNFSLPESFWQALQQQLADQQSLQAFKSQQYFALLRNFKRFSWLIPYLFGSSPIVCRSFLQGKQSSLPFKSHKGYLYLEHATSLRMSDLGYTNSSQSELAICYNNLESYLTTLGKAIRIPSNRFAKIGIKVNGEYQQLNSNILQIENELYSPIRAKCVAKSGETPSEALAARGVEYIEIRALDINPFEATGISEQQIYFLDVLLTYCALAPSPAVTQALQQSYDSNFSKAVEQGRDPKLLLDDNGEQKTIKAWGTEIFADLAQMAQLLDSAYQTRRYSEVVEGELAKILDVNLTPSAQLIALLHQDKFTPLTWAKQYQTQMLEQDYQTYSAQYFDDLAQSSLAEQQHIEQQDQGSFDEFLDAYFAKRK